MTLDHIAKMQAARIVKLRERQVEVDRVAGDAAAQFMGRHSQAAEDAARRRAALWLP